MSELLLAQALEVIIDHRGKTPKKLGGNFIAGGVPVISAVNIKSGRLELGAEQRGVPEELFRRWMPIRLKEGDVLLTSEAPLGEPALVPDDRPLVLGQRLFALRGRVGVLDNRYLFYALRYEPVSSQLHARATGTTVLGIRQAELAKIRIPDPGFEQQLSIAKILGALDDTINLNDRLAHDCIALADLIFLQMRANSFAWNHTSFGASSGIFGGGTPSTKDQSFWSGDISWATPTDVTHLSLPYLFNTSRQITESGLVNCASRLYPPGSILMTSRATIGAFAINQVPVAVNQGFIVVVPRHESDRWYLLHEMRNRLSDITSIANGSTFLEVSRSNFKTLSLPLPSEKELRRFHDQVDPLHARARAAVVESTALASLRDMLLPSLMSGKLAIKDAERLIRNR